MLCPSVESSVRTEVWKEIKSTQLKIAQSLHDKIREDSQIHFATGNVFCTFLSDPHLETFQSKIDNQFKMCSLPDADDA